MDAEGPQPRVALVHDWLTGMRGGEKVLEILANLFPAAPIYTLFHFPGTVSVAIESHPVHTSFLQHLPGLRRNYRRYLPLYPTAIEKLDLSAYDVLISTSHCVAKGVLRAPQATHICYCHTPMRYVWDQRRAYFPDERGPIGWLRELALDRLQRWDVETADRVDFYIANSSFVADRIDRYYDRRAEVIHPPVDTTFFAPAEIERQEFCLMVSALSPYKRIDLAIDACQQAGLELRVVGDGPERRNLERRGADGVRLLGRVEDSEIRDLLRRARCFVQPGVEDFGISSVEALACGCPIVALGRGGIVDIVEDGVHGILYSEPESSRALAAAIDKSLTIRFNKTTLRRRAEHFSDANFEDRLRKLLGLRLSGWNLF